MIVMASTSAYTVGIVIVVVIALLIVVSCIKICLLYTSDAADEL